MKKSTKRGFTLIELLVVIAIIALLTGIILTNLVGSKAKARDAQRASDLAQIQLAIEQYFDRCDEYPASPLNVAATNLDCPSDVTLGNYISKLPTDPSTGAAYGYLTNGTPPSDYVLFTTFETTNTSMSQSAPAPLWTPAPPFPQGFSCTNSAEVGGSGFGYCVRPN